MADFETKAKKTFIRQYEATGIRPVIFARVTLWAGTTAMAVGFAIIVVSIRTTGGLGEGIFPLAFIFLGAMSIFTRESAMVAAGAALLLADRGDTETPPSWGAKGQAEAQDSPSSDEDSAGGASFSLRRSTE